jgi:hypothetical protein
VAGFEAIFHGRFWVITEECRSYLDAAGKLIAEARVIFDSVHGTQSLTRPPG